VLLGGYTELIVEQMLEDLLDGFLVDNHTPLHRLLNDEKVALGLCLLADIAVLLIHTDQEARGLGLTDDHGDDALGGVITSETGLECAGTDVDDDGLTIFLHLNLTLVFKFYLFIYEIIT
jgi:hypothetical protein